jgi:hypothetical protein
MRPDKQLAGLLGLTDANATLGEAYMRVDATAPPGTGITSVTMQYHGTADRYTLSGATAVATLYSNATTATANPAVTLRAVGSNGGHAAAFTYDLARSVVYTRQGNPAWAGQERDGVAGIRPDDLFYGARAGDVQPDWVDTSKIAIPQADEQQRLLVNLITLMERDRLPLPRFWYLPRGEQAVVVMSGDDHSPTQAPGGTASHFDRFKQLSPAGCSVANWECIRGTSYVYPNSVLTTGQTASRSPSIWTSGRVPPRRSPRRKCRRRSTPSSRSSRRSTRASPRLRPFEHTASSGRAGSRARGSRSSTTSGWTPTTTTSPAPGSARVRGS